METGKKGAEVFVANESFVAEIKGQVYVVHKGVTRIRAGHVLLQDGRELLFKPDDESTHYEVEQATAAPGEKRGGKAKE